jgi:hypothetical protein
MSCASALRVLSRLFGFSHTKQQHLKEQKKKTKMHSNKRTSTPFLLVFEHHRRRLEFKIFSIIFNIE